MRFSYSKVETFNQCPAKYDYRYNQKLKVIPEQHADNALWLGTALHLGIETTVEQGVNNYLANFNVVSTDNLNWIVQLEHWIPKVKELLPEGGIHEAKILTDSYVGYIDYVTSDTIYDYKFTVPKNHKRYLKSGQLKVYKYFWEQQNPGTEIKHLKYIFIPKCNIRQKKTETVQQFRDRLYGELDKLSVEIVEVPFDESSVTKFTDDCKRIETTTEFPKCVSRLCQWCDYEPLCQRGGGLDGL